MRARPGFPQRGGAGTILGRGSGAFRVWEAGGDARSTAGIATAMEAAGVRGEALRW